MDPLSQGVVGATLSQAACLNKKELVYASILGFLAGMAADLDILIRSDTDTLLYLVYHRQFTHSLIFIPFGGLICAVVFWKLPFFKISFNKIYKYCTLGYATHAILDCCTTYGTQWFWPFSNYRVAWNSISIIDPLFTIPTLILVLLTYFKGEAKWARMGLAYMLFYISVGFAQRSRALSVGYEIASARGHNPIRLEAKPSFANLVLWKVVYETKERFYVDAVKLLGEPRVYQGTSIEKLVVQRDFPWIQGSAIQKEDIERFRWFSKGYIAKSPDRENFIVDVRYSLVPNEVDALWGIELLPSEVDKHAVFKSTRSSVSKKSQEFLKMLFEY